MAAGAVRARAGSDAVIERLLRSVDFERVLRTTVRARSTHFAAHHVGDAPSLPGRPRKGVPAAKLSTTDVPNQHPPVDDSAMAKLPEAPPAGLWLGAVVPKRHARRAVTRTLLKRQIRAAMCAQAERLAAGLWVIRLRAPFDLAQFPSARSQALRNAARDELDGLLAGAAQRERRR